MSKTMLVAFAATLAFALPTAASALSTNYDVLVNATAGTETRTIGVSVADLNLASDHGLRVADSRITRAARQVCGYVRGSVIKPTNDYRTCFDAALGDAQQELDTLAQVKRQG